MKHVSELCKNAEAESKKLYFSLICDEMAIRKLIEFDGKKLQGYIDIGDNTNDCNNNTEATNVLVFMLVGINSYFKIVVAYYFIYTLSGKEKSNILSEILHVANSYGIPICNVTFDGAATNISMVEQLGAKISTSPDELITHFEHLHVTCEKQEDGASFSMTKIRRNHIHFHYEKNESSTSCSDL